MPFVLILGLLLAVPQFAGSRFFPEAQDPAQNNFEVLAERKFALKTASEGDLTVVAAAPDTNWGTVGHEAAVITVFVDRAYNQDIILFQGEQRFAYRALLGPVPAGDHTLTLKLNRAMSSKAVKGVDIRAIRVGPMSGSSSIDSLALTHAPILYARKNSIGRYTDIPLVMWYEVFQANGTTTIKYSYIFTNEDAGTATEALMARWGRTTDIEWAYEIELKQDALVRESFQAVNHKATEFRGKKIAGHAVLIVASDNNNFADTGESAMRFAFRPVMMDLSSHSREELMDRQPWMYRLATEELTREGKISEEGGHKIRDPRNYLYVEAYAPKEKMGIGITVRDRDGRLFDGNLGRQDLRITRDGWFRVAIRLPAGASPANARGLVVDCKPMAQADPVPCEGVRIQKTFRLDERYRPRLMSLPLALVRTPEAAVLN